MQNSDSEFSGRRLTLVCCCWVSPKDYWIGADDKRDDDHQQGSLTISISPYPHPLRPAFSPHGPLACRAVTAPRRPWRRPACTDRWPPRLRMVRYTSVCFSVTGYSHTTTSLPLSSLSRLSSLSGRPPAGPALPDRRAARRPRPRGGAPPRRTPDPTELASHNPNVIQHPLGCRNIWSYKIDVIQPEQCIQSVTIHIDPTRGSRPRALRTPSAARVCFLQAGVTRGVVSRDARANATRDSLRRGAMCSDSMCVPQSPCVQPLSP